MKNTINEPSLSYKSKYTYSDYLLWTVQERYEIIKGKLFKMSPAPARFHQEISRNLSFELLKFFENKDCKVYSAPFDIRLIDPQKQSTKDKDIITVFQPDLCVICDKSKLDTRGCIGSPDFIIEILSPSNSSKEMKHKYQLFEENGVREYWVVDYTHKLVFIYVLENGKYRGYPPLTTEDIATSHIFPDLHFDLHKIFKDVD